MSKVEAEYDGIQYSYDGHRGRIQYKIPCDKCGAIIISGAYRRNMPHLCNYCKGLIKKKKEAMISKEILMTETKAEKRFNEAVCEIKKQVKNFLEYENAVKIAQSRTELYGSIPEAMVAIELIKLKHKIIPQQKVGKYKVDFVIPKEKIAIEVDGKIFHVNKNNNREAEIQLLLGLDWKIIHIPAELIRKNITKLKDAISIFYK